MPKSAKAAVVALPERDEALKQLFRRQVQALMALLIRILLLAMLSAFLLQQWPLLRQYRWFLDTLTGILCIGPLLKSVTRNWGWRIALGKAYLAADRFGDAEALLRPLEGIQGQLFDLSGEGLETLKKARAQQKG